MKSLVIYYTRTGKTEIVAKEIAKEFNSKLRKLKEKDNRKGFFGYMKAGLDTLKNKKVELINPEYNLNYDIIFIGTPTWGWRPTPAIMTYFDNCDFKNKKIILFSTFVSSPGDSVKIMSKFIHKKKGKVIFSFSINTLGSKENIIKRTNRNFPGIKKVLSV